MFMKLKWILFMQLLWGAFDGSLCPQFFKNNYNLTALQRMSLFRLASLNTW